jgi:hypothetical protein
MVHHARQIAASMGSSLKIEGAAEGLVVRLTATKAS